MVIFQDVNAQGVPTPPASSAAPASTGAGSTATLPLQQPQPRIHIDNGDLLEVKIYSSYGAPDITQTSRVSDAGDISLPFVGPLHVGGLTPEQAQAVVESKFRNDEVLTNPQVSVFIAEYATQGVSVLGEVNKPGFYPIVAARRLFDVIAAAGGITDRAGNTVTVTPRTNPSAELRVHFADEGNASQQNIEIAPGDTVVVARAGVVYVVGAVQKPGGFTLHNNESLSVLEAIALAEGLKTGAAPARSKVIRKTSTGFQEIPIELDKILSAKTRDLLLRPDDIVFVPTSTAKNAFKRGLEAVLQTATGVAIYRR